MDTVLSSAPCGWIEASDVPAPAKINLALHVTGRRADGYHELDSLVVFAAAGDRLTVAPGASDRLTIEGPFAHGLPLDRGNIILRALDLARARAADHGIAVPPLDIRLEKRLPVASGLGGGSADAACLLRLLGDAAPALRAGLRADAIRLGADVPMCLDGAAARVSGLGEIGEAVPRMPALPLVLVNPLVAVPTPAVFAALERRRNPPLESPPEAGFASLDDLVRYLRACRNDLEAPARRLAPVIAAVEACLAGALVTRMSGSGATVFGLFACDEDAGRAAAAIRAARTHWWTVATTTARKDPAA